MSLVHDYGHFLAHRYRPKISVDDLYRRVPESERFADAFARYFLMPSSSIMKRFSELHRPEKNFSLADLGTLAYSFGVSIQALVLRLEEMKLLPAGAWQRLQERGLKARELQNKLGLAPLPGRDTVFPLRYTYLAFEALSQSLIAEGRFARLLEVDLLEATKIAQALEEQVTTPS
jgi:Zn-dependent peptidase ImmA (M78 family)